MPPDFTPGSVVDKMRLCLIALFAFQLFSLSALAGTKAAAPGNAPAVLTAVNYWSNNNYTQVTLQLDRPAAWKSNELDKGVNGKAGRIYIDINGVWLGQVARNIAIGDNLVKRVRLGQNKADVVRVVLDTGFIKDYKIVQLADPHRLVIYLWGGQTSEVFVQEHSGAVSRPEVKEVKELKEAKEAIPVKTGTEPVVVSALPPPPPDKSTGSASVNTAPPETVEAVALSPEKTPLPPPVTTVALQPGADEQDAPEAPLPASEERSLWQRLLTRDRHSGPLTRAFSEKSYRGAYYLITPTLTVAEEFNDNIHETRGNRASDFITSVSPAISMLYSARKWDWNIAYRPTYRHYLHNAKGDEVIHNASLAGNIRVVSNFLFLNVSDAYSRVSTDPNRDALYAEQFDQNVFSVSPYLEYRLAPRWTANGGYRYTNRSYNSSAAFDNQEHGVFLELTREMTQQTALFAGAAASRVDTSAGEEFSRFSYYAGIRYSYGTGSSVDARGGYSLFMPQTGNSTTSPYWNLGLTHLWRTFTLDVKTGVTYDTEHWLNASERRFVNVRLVKAYHRGSLGISGAYAQIFNSQAGTIGSRWYSAGADAAYELTPRAKATASVNADKYLNEAEYRNIFTLGVSYELYYDLSLAAGCSRIARSSAIFTPSGEAEVNRVYMSVTKSY